MKENLNFCVRDTNCKEIIVLTNSQWVLARASPFLGFSASTLTKWEMKVSEEEGRPLFIRDKAAVRTESEWCWLLHAPLSGTYSRKA